MINTFNQRPNFILSDPRQQRPATWQYTVTADLMTTRHELFFHKTDLSHKRVLDLGCCCAATGAWVLDRGAKHYTGVELQDKFVDSSRANLSCHYDLEKWDIVHSDVETFLEQCDQSYDVVIMVGVLHCLFDYQKILQKLTSIGKEIIIECFHPYNAFKDLYPELDLTQRYDLCKTLSLVQIAAETGTAGENGGSWVFDGVRLSMGAIKNVFGYLGWDTDLEFNRHCQQQLPEVYALDTPSYCPRYVIRSVPSIRTVFEFVDGYQNPTQTNYEYKHW
jgi:precorrin-6B methylase 2